MVAYVFLPFVIGVASGLVANYIYDRYFRRDNR